MYKVTDKKKRVLYYSSIRKVAKVTGISENKLYYQFSRLKLKTFDFGSYVVNKENVL